MLSDHLPAAEPGLWTIGVAAATLAGWLITGWIAVALGSAVLVLAAWRWAAMVNGLRQQLAKATGEQAALQEALRRSQAMEALGRLTVGVAHDFNNHLTVISSNLELAARRTNPDQDRLLRHTDAAMQGVRRAAILTGRLLSFSRQPAVEREAVEVDRLVLGLTELLRRTLGDRISLDVRLSGSPWFAWIDINQMENALLSLVVNARDQVPEGGVLTIAVANVRLDPAFVAAHPAISPGDHVQISVNGPANSPCEPVAELTSADLFMVRAFVREAGGCLLQSDPAKGGLSLRLFLPRYMPPSMAGNGKARVAGGRTRILVVEDDPVIRSVCVEALTGAGHEVLEAPDAMEAFRLIADHGGIDLLFTDLGLPGGVSGRALAEAARNVDPGIRVLFMTGYVQDDLPDRSSVALLRKPFNPAQLSVKVQEVLAEATAIPQSETVQG